MARPLEFHREEALDRALDLFWDRGFEATSLRALCAATGLSAPSLYNSFGDKRQLFLQALEHYAGRVQAARIAELEATERSPRRRIETLLQDMVRCCLAEGDRRGCFLVNTALELAPHDPEIAATVHARLEEMRRFLARQIAEARSAGEIAATADESELSHALLADVLGLRVLARAGFEASALNAAARRALARLD